MLSGIPSMSGCTGLVLAALGCAVTATDLVPNLPLLASNYERNGMPWFFASVWRACTHIAVPCFACPLCPRPLVMGAR